MSRYNVEKKEYVELLNKALEPLTDFGSVTYMNLHSAGTEFIKYVDAMGSAKFLNVTSLDKERIFIEIITIIAGNQSSLIVEDPAKCRAIAKLFMESECK